MTVADASSALPPSSLGSLCVGTTEGDHFLAVLGVTSPEDVGGLVWPAVMPVDPQEVAAVDFVRGLRRAVGDAVGRVDVRCANEPPSVVFVGPQRAAVAVIGVEAVAWAETDRAVAAAQVKDTFVRLGPTGTSIRCWRGGSLLAVVTVDAKRREMRAADHDLLARLDAASNASTVVDVFFGLLEP